MIMYVCMRSTFLCLSTDAPDPHSRTSSEEGLLLRHLVSLISAKKVAPEHTTKTTANMLLRFVPAWQETALLQTYKQWLWWRSVFILTHTANYNQVAKTHSGQTWRNRNGEIVDITASGSKALSPSLFLLQVHYDGWSHVYDEWMDSDHPDIHPAGWCEATNHPLKVAPRDAKTHQPHGSNPRFSVFALQSNLEAEFLQNRNWSYSKRCSAHPSLFECM